MKAIRFSLVAALVLVLASSVFAGSHPRTCCNGFLQDQYTVPNFIPIVHPVACCHVTPTDINGGGGSDPTLLGVSHNPDGGFVPVEWMTPVPFQPCCPITDDPSHIQKDKVPIHYNRIDR